MNSAQSMNTHYKTASQLTNDYEFMESFEHDSTLCVKAPFNTTIEQIKSLFLKYNKLEVKSIGHQVYLVNCINAKTANRAKKDLQYEKINDGFIVITKYLERDFLKEEGRIYLISTKKLDPSKLHAHFENKKFKVSHVRQNYRGYFVQYYNEKDRNEAFLMLKDLHFEGEELEFCYKNHKPQKIESINSGSDLKKKNITEISYNHDDNAFVNEKKSELGKSRDISEANLNKDRVELPSNQEKKLEGNPPINQDEKINSYSPVKNDKFEKIIMKLEKQLSNIVKNDLILGLLVGKLRKMDQATLLDYLIEDDWIILFFKKITEVS